jgi:glutamate--cysteine ligase catalytic subunit
MAEGHDFFFFSFQQPLHENRFVINKSRYDSVDCYLSHDSYLKPEYNDLPLVYDPAIYDTLMSNGKKE